MVLPAKPLGLHAEGLSWFLPRCYSCNMTTATEPRTTATPAIDFETRLTLALAGMDAVLAHKHGVTLADAHAAVQAAHEAPELLDPEPQLFTPHPVLKAAGDVIRARGWIQDDFTSPNGAVCAMAAIRIVLYGDDWDSIGTDSREDGPVEELLNRIAIELGEPSWSVTLWNDSQPNVDAVLRLLY